MSNTKPKITWYQAYAPTGAEIDRTYERLTAGSRLEGFYRQDDGSLMYEHGGNTEIFWDGSETITRGGKTVFLDTRGDEWTADQLTFKDDAGNVVTGPLAADDDNSMSEDDKMRTAARGMLAALKAAAGSTSVFQIGAYTGYVMMPRALYDALETAIAAAEEVGINA